MKIGWVEREPAGPLSGILRDIHPAEEAEAMARIMRGEQLELFPRGQSNARPPCKGGVYALRDPATERVMRTGRTKNLESREAQHGRDPLLRDFKFEPLFRTDDYNKQRGLQQLVDELLEPPLNK